MADTKALEVIKQYQSKGALVFIDENDLQPQRMFRTVTTMIPVVRSDFHDQPINGEMMPKAHHLHRIAEDAGITFDTIDIKKNETSWTVTARAFRRGPDGTIGHVDASYDYDWVDRAKDGPKKFALQRAETGAQLRAIRKILGMPVAFSKDNFERAIAVCRIVINTDEMLDDPGMRQAAISHAVGATRNLFGPDRNVTPREQIGAPEASGTVVDDDDDVAFGDGPTSGGETDPERKAIADELEQWAAKYETEGKIKAADSIREKIADENIDATGLIPLRNDVKTDAEKRGWT